MSNGKQRDPLTNEYLTKHFADNFSLALTAIQAARAVIESGKEFRLGQLLDSVAKSKMKEVKSTEMKMLESEHAEIDDDVNEETDLNEE